MLQTLILFGGVWPVALLAADASNTSVAQTDPVATQAKLSVAKADLLYPTDVIKINVADDEKASHEYKIEADGKIKPVYLKTAVQVAGLSISAAGDALSKAYMEEKIFVNPHIKVSISPSQVFFIGEVNKPGAIPIPTGQKLTLVQAFNAAGGPTHNAAGAVTITRIKSDGSTETLKNVDLIGTFHGRNSDVALENGDIVLLNESLLCCDWQ